MNKGGIEEEDKLGDAGINVREMEEEEEIKKRVRDKIRLHLIVDSGEKTLKKSNVSK